MIAIINGILLYKSIDYTIVDVNGVGYRVFVPLSTFYELPDTGQPVVLNIYTHFKADSIGLFGFNTNEEMDIFKLLILVTGIGPKLAMNILSGISVEELAKAVSSGNLSRLMSIPGVGRKMAERMILELKDKVLRLKPEGVVSTAGDKRISEEVTEEDVLSALINLGYKRNAAKNALDKVIDESGEKLTLEVLLKKALKNLSYRQVT
ncbi:MAG: Holliday junction branch migration protein RuvA [Thermodesulfobacteriota bacterium]|nr:Holliday junction branch migration protein RuvA [Thermodesulfobacteriota bacterium]